MCECMKVCIYICDMQVCTYYKFCISTYAIGYRNNTHRLGQKTPLIKVFSYSKQRPKVKPFLGTKASNQQDLNLSDVKEI